LPLEFREQAIGAAHSVRIAGHALRAAILPLGHQVRTLQHGDVLLDRCKRHLVTRRQLADGRLRAHHARQDVAPRRVGQCPEQVIQFGGRWLSMCNHMVVDNNT
jgi:hypothetical protein